MIKKLLLGVVIIVAVSASFIVGRIVGVRAEQLTQAKRAMSLDAMNALARYQLFSRLSQDISAKREAAAQCSSDLMASANANAVRTCLGSATCRELVETEIRKAAPELVSPDSKLPFHYYSERESCRTAS